MYRFLVVLVLLVLGGCNSLKPLPVYRRVNVDLRVEAIDTSYGECFGDYSVGVESSERSWSVELRGE